MHNDSTEVLELKFAAKNNTDVFLFLRVGMKDISFNTIEQEPIHYWECFWIFFLVFILQCLLEKCPNSAPVHLALGIKYSYKQWFLIDDELICVSDSKLYRT